MFDILAQFLWEAYLLEQKVDPHRLLVWHFEDFITVKLQKFIRQKDHRGQPEQFWETITSLKIPGGKTQNLAVANRDYVMKLHG